MKVLIIGGKGSIGSRYAAILEHLGVDHEVLDLWSYPPSALKSDADLCLPYWEKTFDRAIIATPTRTHYMYCNSLMRMDKPFLCEKPLTGNIHSSKLIMEEAKERGVEGYVVNNYCFVRQKQETYKISYNYYNSGKDGLYNNLCQLIYLDNDAEINNESPVFDMTMNGMKITLADVENSYIAMIQAWLTDDEDSLWTLEDGYKMEAAVDNRYAREGTW